MDAAQNILSITDVTLYQRHMVFSRQVIVVTVNLELPETGGQLGAGFPGDMFVVETAVVLQCLDGDDLQTPLLRFFQQLSGAHHSAIIPHDFAAQAALGQARQAAQIYRRLSVTVAGEHASPPATKGNTWPGRRRSSGRVDRSTHLRQV